MATQSCSKCGKPLAPGGSFCTQCGTRTAAPASAPPAASPPTPPAAPQSQPLASTQGPPGARPRTCVNCKTQMAGMGQVMFRTGGYVGGAGVLVGSWNAAAENLQPFSLYYCQQCGKFDLYYAGT